MEETALIERIVDEVIKRLGARGKRVLALFCGGSIGAPESRSELAKLQAAGYSIRVVFTPWGEKVLGAEWIRTGLDEVEVITEASGKAPGALLKETDITLVPVLTLNTAAKVAHGIADTLVATLIMDSLLLGKPVIAVRDACDLGNPFRAKLGMTHGAPAYRSLLQANLNCLEEFGIRLVAAGELAAAVLGLGGLAPAAATSASTAVSSAVFTGRVLTRNDVAAWEGRVLRVSRDTLVTPLAYDLARDQGIEIISS